MKINVENGSLSDIVTIPTGQKGALGLNAPTTPGTAAAPGGKDPLFSQDSIIVADDVSLLFVSVMTCELISNSVSFHCQCWERQCLCLFH